MRHARNLALAAASLAATTASASTLDRPPLRQMVEDADLVFEGVVTDVTYRNSSVYGPDDVARPHTFVTFDVLRTFKGRSAAGSRIVLRLLGGSKGNGRTLEVLGVPLFAPGDRDVLFVARNGAEACPLVGWEHGRFRLVDGAVMRTGDQPLWLDAQDELVGPPESGSAIPPGSRPATPGEFASLVDRRVRERFDEDALAQLPPTHSADASAPFRIRRLRVVPPPADAGE